MIEERTEGLEEIDNSLGKVRIIVRQVADDGKWVEGGSSYQVTVPMTRFTTVRELIQKRVLPEITKKGVSRGR